MIISFALFSFFPLSFLPPLGSTAAISPGPPSRPPSGLLPVLLLLLSLSCARSRARSRQNMDEVGKIKEQIAAIWDKAREAQGL